MDEARITGGSISYLRRVKTGDYEHAEAKAEISFSTGELIDEAGDTAKAKVYEMLGLKPEPKPRTRKADAGPPISKELPVSDSPLSQSSVQLTLAQPSIAPTVGTSPDPLVVAATGIQVASSAPATIAVGDPLAPGLGTSAPAASTSTVAGGGPSSDPLAPNASSGTTSAVGAPAAVSAASGGGDPLSGAQEDWGAVREITDKDLRDACALRNHELLEANKDKDATLVTRSIHDLVGKFVPPGKRTSDIPQNQRQKFIDDLKAIKVS
jgi:hypothetical protein